MDPPRIIADHGLQQPTPPQNYEGVRENGVATQNREDEAATSPDTSGIKKKRKRPSIDTSADQFPEMDSILSQKRKPREKTACLPCRKRKVGCDRMQPCKTCLERRHPEVCIYENTDASTLYGGLPGLPAGTENVTVPKGYLDHLMNRVESLEASVRELSSDIRTVLRQSHPGTFSKIPVVEVSSKERFGESEEEYRTREGIHTNNPITGQVVHVGGNSVPALLISLAKQQGNGSVTSEDIDWKELVNGAIIPLLGLDNESATYPFVDLWSTPEGVLSKIRRLVEVLPSEADCKAYFTAYIVISQSVFPGVADVKEFEEELMQFHLRRAQEPIDEAVTEQTVYGKSLTWIALLFAVLASGCHFSDRLDRASRELTSKVFVCCSFECLRLSNFLSNPNLECIQAMAVFLNTLLNLYQAGVVWGMLGLTIRLAQSLGLHQRCIQSTPIELRNKRAKIWWSIIWQDSLVSITYDRSGTAMGLDGPMHLPPEHDDPSGQWRYLRCMYKLCTVGLNIVRERHSQLDASTILHKMHDHEREIDTILHNAVETLRDFKTCRSFEDRGQHWVFKLHRNYILSEICRPAVSPSAPKTELARRMRHACVDALAQVVESWIGLYHLASHTQRSWPAMHRALSSALLLGILHDNAHPDLLTDFLHALEECTAGINPGDLVPPIQRSIFWLRKLTHASENSDTSSPALPSLGSGDSPYALIDRMMWQSSGTP